MRALDTNVLVHYHREKMPKHPEAVALLRKLAEGQVPWGIPVFCIGEFLRVVTHLRVFNPPTPLEEALSVIDALLESPTVRLLMPGERYWKLLTDTASRAQTTGNLVSMRRPPPCAWNTASRPSCPRTATSRGFRG